MITLDDISEARRSDIEALRLNEFPTHDRDKRILIALAQQLECYERRIGAVPTSLRACAQEDFQLALQMWETAYEAAGGVVQP